jgi:molecular chaperone HtpG
VKKIASHITKKVADRLQDIFKTQRDEFEKKWDGLKMFINYGMLTDEKFYDRAKDFALFKNTDGKFFTYDEYKTLIAGNQTDKNDSLIYIYTTDVVAQYGAIENAKAKGYDVVIMDSQLDSHFINQLEQKFEKSRFVRVDSEVADKLIEKDEVRTSKISVEVQEQLRPVFKAHVAPSYAVMFENLNETEMPILITQSEFMRRMKDMAAVGGGMNFYGNLPDSYNLVINTNHPLISKLGADIQASVGANVQAVLKDIEPLKAEADVLEKAKAGKKADEVPSAEKEKLEDLEKQISTLNSKKDQILTDFGRDNKIAKQLIDLALISHNMLKGEELSKFVKRSVELIS